MTARPATFDAPGTAPRLAFNVPFVDAIAWAQERGAVLPDEFYAARLQAFRARSFTVTGLAALDQIQAVADSLAEALATGEGFREWQQRVTQDTPELLGLPGGRLELIYRNAVQTAYGIGRTVQQRENVASRPYLMWDAVNDDRTRPSHRAMDGHVAAIDDPIWQTWAPPAGHNCLLPSTRVRGEFILGLQTPYAGPAVEVLTGAGARLSVTGNHPVLTSRGWIAAKDLQVGDDLLSYGGVVDAAALPVEDDQHAPPTAEQLFHALAAQALGVAQRAAFDLHGDAQFGEGDVHVAAADGELVHRLGAQPLQLGEKRQLVPADRGHAGSGALRSGGLAFGGMVGSADLPQDALHVGLRHAGGLGDGGRAQHLVGAVEDLYRSFVLGVARIGCTPCSGALALNGGPVVLHRGPLHTFGFAPRAHLDPMAHQQVAHRAASDASGLGQRLLARAGAVLRDQLGHVGRDAPRSGLRAGAPDLQALTVRTALDTRVAQQTVEQAGADTVLFQELAHRGAGLVRRDQVVGLRHFTFRGHVYDFETRQGWMVAEGVIVSNCRCSRIALTPVQARARGYPKPTPTAEPDPGWSGDPTEGNDDLLAIVRQRLDAQVVPSAGKAASIASEPGPARDVLVRAGGALRQPQGLMFQPYDNPGPRGEPDRSTPARSAAVAFEDVARVIASEERAAAFTLEGAVIIERVGEPDRVGFTDEELAAMRGAVFTHTHPADVTFSMADLQQAHTAGLAELRAAGPQFRYILQPGPDGWPDPIVLRLAHIEAIKQARAVVADMVIRQGLRPVNATAEMMHRAMVALAARFGMIYAREFT